jgi:hypothetical protein
VGVCLRRAGGEFELSALERHEARAGEGVVLFFGDQVPGKHEHLPGGGHDGDLEASAGPDAAVERAQRSRRLRGNPCGFDEHAPSVRAACLGDVGMGRRHPA